MAPNQPPINRRKQLFVYDVRNVHEAIWFVVNDVQREPKLVRAENSRNGLVKEFVQPVTTVYRKPTERVLFYPKRDANPFFHFFEGLWMLAGRQDVKLMQWFNKRMAEYSDDGEKFHAAYGHRWRVHFERDQLDEVVSILKKEPLSRRAIVTMWDPKADLGFQGKDFPCNMIISFQLRDGLLDMRVHNRSNDMIYGAYGANAVHMSMLQEYVASRLGAKTGTYYQISDNLHLYTEFDITPKVIEELTMNGVDSWNYYKDGIVEPYPMFDDGIDPELWDKDLHTFFSIAENHSGDAAFSHVNFFHHVAIPLFDTYVFHKSGDHQNALQRVSHVKAKDWQMAAEQWLRRRYES